MNWYRIEVKRSENELYGFVGSSKATAEELRNKLENKLYIHLENLLYYNEKGKLKDWNEMDEEVLPEIYLNPDKVISVMQFRKDPRDLEEWKKGT